MSIEKLRARYSANETRSNVFFEGSEAEMEIFCTPLTVFESDKIQRASKGSDFLYCLELVCLKALDKNGKRLFPTMKEKQLLQKNVLAADVAEIATWLGAPEAIEEDEKN
jgi:hypothetical protein